MTKLILGSQSPRRKEIFSYFSYPFEQVSPSFDESTVAFHGDPKGYVLALAESKGASLSSYEDTNTVILTADTVVFHEGKLFGKPNSHQHAVEVLTELSGKWHSVFTGIVVRHAGNTYSAVEETRVLFNNVTAKQISLYLDQLHCEDKAGAYLIQGAGSILINKIEGCYYNVVGLPVNAVVELLAHAGVDLWQHLSP